MYNDPQMKIIKIILSILTVITVGVLVLTQDTLQPGDTMERVRYNTRAIEFDYVSWMANAFVIKGLQAALPASYYQTDPQQHHLVQDYIKLVRQLDELDNQIDRVYTDPTVTDPAQTAAPLIAQRNELQNRRNQIGPICETILQQQTSVILNDDGLTVGGQPIPPVLYHITPLPMALIVSPRSVIQQDANISLLPGITTEEQIKLEKDIEQRMGVSALVVPIGGVGVYPTMIMSTDDLPWLNEVIAHEWTHNYLTLRPLGMNYETSPELRTMNETTASLVGKEVGAEVLKRYYPELVPPPPAPTAAQQSQKPASPPPPVFNYRAEMHTTRVEADRLLSLGKIQEAEDYMEQRRRFFWENGYQIRRLNQAYFAFYGAYADEPGGAAGKDPVGPAVRALRQKSASLADFINRIAWMTSFEELQKAVQ